LRRSTKVDLVLTDINMPKNGRSAAIGVLKASPQWHTIPGGHDHHTEGGETKVAEAVRLGLPDMFASRSRPIKLRRSWWEFCSPAPTL
jgi:CheY-like chemotaxis protein